MEQLICHPLDTKLKLERSDARRPVPNGRRASVRGLGATATWRHPSRSSPQVRASDARARGARSRSVDDERAGGRLASLLALLAVFCHPAGGDEEERGQAGGERGGGEHDGGALEGGQR